MRSGGRCEGIAPEAFLAATPRFSIGQRRLRLRLERRDPCRLLLKGRRDRVGGAGAMAVSNAPENSSGSHHPYLDMGYESHPDAGCPPERPAILRGCRDGRPARAWLWVSPKELEL